jgi:ferrous iron transport protein B
MGVRIWFSTSGILFGTFLASYPRYRNRDANTSQQLDLRGRMARSSHAGELDRMKPATAANSSNARRENGGTTVRPDVTPSGRTTKARSARRSIILVGNPNVGKSVVFKNLTGRYVTISNFPGTTVEITRSVSEIGGRPSELFDTPGVNDLAQPGEEARVTREIIEQHPESLLVQVADAKNLRRALLLTYQLAEIGRPMILVLNMMDELEACGAKIDVEALARIVGVPVVPTVALQRSGMEQVVAALDDARPADPNGHVDDPELEDYQRNRSRLEQINTIMSRTYELEQPRRPRFGVRLGFWAMHPVKGLLMLAAVLSAVFWFVGLLGAGSLVDLLEVSVFQQRLNPLAIRAADAVLPFPHTHRSEEIVGTFSLPLSPAHEWQFPLATRTVIVSDYAMETGVQPSLLRRGVRLVHDFFVGEFGLITMALSYAFAIVLPIVTMFFFVFSILEDSGYLSRLSIMVNRLFRMMGLSGKAVLPMILGLGCATMATMTTRVLDNRKERIVTTLLLALAVPCSAQLGVLLAMMSRVSLGAAMLWVGLVGLVMISVGWLASRLFGSESSDFILEIPPMRRPHLANVMTKTLARLEWYLKEVIPLFMLGTAILFVLDRLHVLGAIASLGEPLVSGWLGLPKETTAAFLIGFMRRDFGAVFLLDASMGPDPLLTPHQILVAMVTITLFMPCIATLFMITELSALRTVRDGIRKGGHGVCPRLSDGHVV